MIEFTLGWPPSELSPNKRLHWSKVSSAKAQYRTACWAMVLEQVGAVRPDIDGNLHLVLEFVPPDRRSYDRDNLVARMKSGLDGVADGGLGEEQILACARKTARVGEGHKGTKLAAVEGFAHVSISVHPLPENLSATRGPVLAPGPLKLHFE